MVTPDFEDWLRRQDMEVEDTVTVDAYTGYLHNQLGISGGSLDVAKDVWAEKYDILPSVGVNAFSYRGGVRYGIEGYKGAFGREKALLFGADNAEQRGMYEEAEILLRWYENEFGEGE